jgi:beta-phosphoglucomutase-like phosphatase (HAD superfamily)
LTKLRFLLCDADGNLFPSEAPAFAASAGVTNRFLESVGVDERYGPERLQAIGIGRTFRTNAAALASEHGATVDERTLEEWIAEENAAVTTHLARALRPDPDVIGPVTRLAELVELAAVSSSSLSRLDACFRVTGLGELFPPERRFSAEDSLPSPTSKPAPDVYLHALAALEVDATATLAVEDSVAGVESARGAGIRAVGNLAFVPEDARSRHAAQLEAAGAEAVVESWTGVEEVARRLKWS